MESLVIYKRFTSIKFTHFYCCFTPLHSTSHHITSLHSTRLIQCDLFFPTGPGGLLGVLPAVEMKNWSAASIYLTCFVVSSTLCMGFFAALYGETTKKLGDMNGFVEFFVNMFSCSLSLIVGVLWVVLSCMGKLEEFFED